MKLRQGEKLELSRVLSRALACSRVIAQMREGEPSGQKSIPLLAAFPISPFRSLCIRYGAI